MVKKPGCVSHFLSSEADRERKAICSVPLPQRGGGKRLLLTRLPGRPHGGWYWSWEGRGGGSRAGDADRERGDVEAGDGDGGVMVRMVESQLHATD